MLLRYILQKYLNLSELSFCISTDYQEFAAETEFPCDEWDELIAALAPRLQTLRIQLCCSEEFVHVVQALDDNNCQLKSLTFSGILCDAVFDLLLTLKLSRRLQSFTTMDDQGCIYPQLGYLSRLPELHLNSVCDDESFYFIDLLNICADNLESLKITNLLLECPSLMPSQTADVIFHKLKKLEFTRMDLPTNLGTFISWSFPQLHTLKLKHCFERSIKNGFRNEGLHIIIPNINLRYLQVIDSLYLIAISWC
jgi:hypothetical protein